MPTNTTTATATPFGDRMKAARTAAGLSTVEAAYGIRSRLPEPLWISNDPIRRMENGKTIEAKADPLLVTALAAVYGVRVRQLSPLVADALGMVDELLHATAEQGKLPTEWETVIPMFVNPNQLALVGV